MNHKLMLWEVIIGSNNKTRHMQFYHQLIACQ